MSSPLTSRLLPKNPQLPVEKGAAEIKTQRKTGPTVSSTTTVPAVVEEDEKPKDDQVIE